MSDLVCHKCGRYFSLDTGEYTSDFVVMNQRDRDKHLCKQCAKALNYSAPVGDEFDPT